MCSCAHDASCLCERQVFTIGSDVDDDRVVLDEGAVEQLDSELVGDLALDKTFQRTSTERRVVSGLGQPRTSLRANVDCDTTIREPAGEQFELNVDDLNRSVLGELTESDNVVDPVDELGTEEVEPALPAGSTS